MVVHVGEEALRKDSQEGQSVLDGVRVAAETSRRIACDASVITEPESRPENRAVPVTAEIPVTVENPAMPVKAGRVSPAPAMRRTRTIPSPIRRALEHRDRGCRFPGCGLRFCDAHHVVHWADGGATRLDNLVLLCRRHHRAVHEEGFGVTIDNGEVAFRTPEGRPIPDAPPAPVISDVARMRVGIDAWTATPEWNGERLDLAWSLRVLRAV